MRITTRVFIVIVLGMALKTRAENGHDLWLRKKPARPVTVVCTLTSPVLTIARQELALGWQGKAGARIVLSLTKDKEIKDDGFRLRPGSIEAHTDAGLLYGVYEVLRRQQTGQPLTGEVCNPSYQRRMLDHWDNPDGSIERGYAGGSIFWRKTDPFTVTDSDRLRWTEYARADASIGINGAVLNNVNASVQMLSAEYLARLKAIADVLRPYGIRSYMAVRFSSPVQLGGLKTADPLNPDVIRWWRDKVKEIYTLIPDFGGFLVKANSEGQPGPQDYGRSHAEGANMMADVIKPYGGIILWRAFVYNASDKDRARQAYAEFTPLDGQFHDNVIVQVKNGPVDFQPREPFSPLFGAMKKTAVAPEFQITQEYLGQSTHLVFLAPMWEECLKSDTWQKGAGSTVAKCTDGSLYPREHTAIAGVSNIGLDVNWCGHPFAQANWYAFGRLAWNDRLTSDRIADEWLRLTFSPSTAAGATSAAPTSADAADWVTHFLGPVKGMMLQSREAAVDYMMPLGLHHLFSANGHYGPGPWWAPKGVRIDWTPPYFHKADSIGIGFDRTDKGSNAVSQYKEPLRSLFNDMGTCPDIYLLWFHHVPWDHRMRNGRTLWDELCYHYDKGVQQVKAFQALWDRVRPYVDKERFELVQGKLRSQSRNAQLWKDACILYFQRFSRRPVPSDIERPEHDLDDIIREDTTRRLFPRRAAGGARAATPSLKEVFQNDFLIGTALNVQQTEGRDPRADTLIRRQFNTATPENIMKAALIHPAWDTYRFEPADQFVEYAHKNGLRINAHTLIWHSQLPAFVRNIKDADSLRKFFVDHITTVAARYDGKVHSWDVVNEALNEDGTLRNSIFLQKLGPDYIVEAFRLAQQAAPHTELCYNDYNIESPAKRAGAIALIKKIQAAGVRIDAVGIQGHWHLGKLPFAQIAESIDAFAALGIKVNFTELDISVLPNPLRGNTADVSAAAGGGAGSNPWPDGLPDSVQDQLAADYAALFKLFLQHRSQIGRITFWGVEDGVSWLNNWPVRGRTNYPLLFDRDYAPKKAFYSVIGQPVAGQHAIGQPAAAQPGVGQPERKDAAENYNSVRTYVNPVLPGDHPDPTLLRVGNDFYHCGSSFHFNPYLPVYHSRDLVHWEVISRVVPPSVAASFVADRPSGGIWQGAITWFYGSYWIYFSSGGQWFSKAESPYGPWSTPVKVRTSAATGDLGYDNSIFVDDDGKPYMLIKNGQKVNRIQALGKDGQLTDSVINLDWINANLQYSWAEGPVMCKRNGYYYYFPAGDVTGGQYVLRTRRLTADSSAWERLGDFFPAVTDPREGFRRPNHISAPLQLTDGTWWTIGQSYERYQGDDWAGTGRQTSLYPVTWEGDRPWGMAPTSRPIDRPHLPQSGILWRSMQGDEFNGGQLGLQWHFLTRKAAADYSLSARKGWIRLTPDSGRTHLVQKETGHYYTVITKVDFDATDTAAKGGIYLTNGNQHVVARLFTGWDNGRRIVLQLDTAVRTLANTAGKVVWLKLERKGHALSGYFSTDGVRWTSLGAPLSAVPIDKEQPNFNSWVGTSVGLFAEGRPADFDLFTCKDAFSPLPAAGYANYYGVRTSAQAGVRTEMQTGDKAVTTGSAQGGWFMISGVETGRKTARAVDLTVAARGAGNLEIWLDDLQDGTLIASIPVKSTGGADHWESLSARVKPFNGHHDIFVKYLSGDEGAVFLRTLQFKN